MNWTQHNINHKTGKTSYFLKKKLVYVSFWIPFTGKTTRYIWNKKWTVSLSVSINLFEDLGEAELNVVQLFDWLTRQSVGSGYQKEQSSS